MQTSKLTCVLVVGLLFQVGPALSDDQEPQPRLVDVHLSDAERRNLIAAPQVFFNAKPSSELANAWASGEVERVRVERVQDGDSNVVQGWIYYPTVAGYQPLVLCISETYPVMNWMHCQEHNKQLGIIGSREE
jgi:hypothetical protein